MLSPPAVADNSDMADEQGMTEPGGTGPQPAEAAAGKPKARDLNELIRYTMWSVFRVNDRAGLELGGHQAAAEVADLLDQAAGKGIVTPGCYDLQAFRADADFMFWWTAPTSDDLQATYVRFRRTRLGRCSEPVWSVMALHRRPSSTKATSRRSWPRRSRARMSACTRSSAPMSGICSIPPSAARCWPSTA